MKMKSRDEGWKIYYESKRRHFSYEVFANFQKVLWLVSVKPGTLKLMFPVGDFTIFFTNELFACPRLFGGGG